MQQYVFMILAGLLIFSSGCRTDGPDRQVFSFSEMAGIPTDNSIVLKTQLAASDSLRNGYLPVRAGYVRFEIDVSPDFSSAYTTPWRRAERAKDYVVQEFLEGLDPSTTYYYRSVVGEDTLSSYTEETHRFKTLPSPQSEESIRFVISSCMHYDRFMMGRNQDFTLDKGEGNAPAPLRDRRLGYPAFETIEDFEPHFHMLNGDNVYYDSRHWRAVTDRAMRHKWHQLFALPRFKNLLGSTSSFWLKDDHDFRCDDCDTTDARVSRPSYELGIRTFREQVPVVNPEQANDKTYRTFRVNRLLQVWMVEGRDYRSPNRMEDGPGKSIWGSEQKQWLKRTLRDSDAEFKLLVSPTPMIGPDQDYKIDNHTNTGGFRYERDTFFAWLTENGFDQQNFYLITGDRHWQYHSVHPSGYEEFSSGSFMPQNSRVGPSPGDPESTDPEGLIRQLYKPSEPMGGFLLIGLDGDGRELTFSFYDDGGALQYEVVKEAI